MFSCLKLQPAELSRLFCLWIKWNHLPRVFQKRWIMLELAVTNKLSRNRQMMWPESDARRAASSQREAKHLNEEIHLRMFKSLSIFWGFHPDTSTRSRFFTDTQTAVTIPSLIITSFLRWGTSAAVWTGQGTFSQRCHHHSCISKPSQLPPLENRHNYLILKQAG